MLKQEKVHAQLSYKDRYKRLDLSTKRDILTNLGNCLDLFLDLNYSSATYLNEVIPDAQEKSEGTLPKTMIFSPLESSAIYILVFGK